MHILIGLVLALVLLYYWLVGHWFARVVMAIILIPSLGVLGGAITADPSGKAPGMAVMGALFGAAAGWFASGAPIYYWRAKVRELNRSVAEHLAPPPGGYTYR
jgi:hypothetical protein